MGVVGGVGGGGGGVGGGGEVGVESRKIKGLSDRQHMIRGNERCC